MDRGSGASASMLNCQPDGGSGYLSTPVDFPPGIISEVNAISRRMLADTGDRRRQRDVADIYSIDAIEAYSVIVSHRLSQYLQ